MLHYLTNSQLKPLVIAYQSNQVLTEELALSIDKLARGVFSKYAWANLVDIDDYANDCVVAFCGFAGRIKPECNIFSYLTTCFMNLLRQRHQRRGIKWTLFSELGPEELESVN